MKRLQPVPFLLTALFALGLPATARPAALGPDMPGWGLLAGPRDEDRSPRDKKDADDVPKAEEEEAP